MSTDTPTPITDKVIQSAISEADSHHDWDERRCAAYALDAVSDGARNLERVAKQLADALKIAGKRCSEIHHVKKHRHGFTPNCPAEAQISAALAAWEKMKP